jgi:hypothetical protein
VTYQFKVQSQNSYSLSPDSETITLLCAFKPEPPLTVSTTNVNELVTIAWDEPVNNGFEIHAYRFFFLTSDGTTFAEESTECDGTNQAIVSGLQCQVALTTFQAAPFSLSQGTSIVVKIVSVNTYGESTESTTGNGAVIRNVPDAPINLQNVAFDIVDRTNPETTTDT